MTPPFLTAIYVGRIFLTQGTHSYILIEHVSFPTFVALRLQGVIESVPEDIQWLTEQAQWRVRAPMDLRP